LLNHAREVKPKRELLGLPSLAKLITLRDILIIFFSGRRENLKLEVDVTGRLRLAAMAAYLS
jgi:hypothetical protein